MGDIRPQPPCNCSARDKGPEVWHEPTCEVQAWFDELRAASSD